MDGGADARTTQGASDHLGRARLSTAESWWWYGIAFVSYVTLAIWHKWLLNWFVGPAWLVAIVWAGPELAGAIRARRHHTKAGRR